MPIIFRISAHVTKSIFNHLPPNFTQFDGYFLGIFSFKIKIIYQLLFFIYKQRCHFKKKVKSWTLLERKMIWWLSYKTAEMRHWNRFLKYPRNFYHWFDCHSPVSLIFANKSLLKELKCCLDPFRMHGSLRNPQV